MNKENSELFAQYQKLAKKADARMRSLENIAESREYFKPATLWAYRKASRDIDSMFGESPKSRFNRMLPDMSKTAIVSAINSVTRFLESPTSTYRGILSIYKKRVETINKLYKTNFTWQDFATFIEADLYERNESKYGSSTLMTKVGYIQQAVNGADTVDGQKIPERIKEAVDTHLVTDDPVDILTFLYAEDDNVKDL